MKIIFDPVSILYYSMCHAFFVFTFTNLITIKGTHSFLIYHLPCSLLLYTSIEIQFKVAPELLCLSSKMEEKEEFIKIIRIVRLTLKFIGIRLLGRRMNNFKELITTTMYCYINMVWLFSILAQFLYFIRLHLMKKNFYDVFYIWPCSSYSILALTKTFAVVYSKNDIEELLVTLEGYHNEQKDDECKTAYRKSQEDSFKYLKMIMIITIVTNFFMTLMFCITPFLIMTQIYIKTKKFEILTMFPITYIGLDPYASFTEYVIVYIHQSFSAIFAIMNTAAPDMLLFFLCTCLNIEFQLLGFRSEKVLRDSVKAPPPDGPTKIETALSVEDTEDDIDDDVLKTNIRNIILRHLELMEKVELVDKIHAKATLINFVVSSVLICATAFNSVTMKDLNVFKFALMLMTALWQLLWFCYYGDLIMRSNGIVADCLVKCNWYIANEDFKSMMLIMLARTERACRITAFKFVDVNLQSYRKILATSWSYFALLNTVYASKQADSNH